MNDHPAPDSAPDAHSESPDRSPSPPMVLELPQFLPYRLSVLSNRISQSIAQVYDRRFGLSMTEWRVMAIAGRYPDLSANEVAQRSAMDKVAVSRAVARLLERGFLNRETHSSDRRRSVLSLSHEGMRVYDEVAPLALRIEQRLLAGFSAEERNLLFNLIDRLDELELQIESDH